MNHVLSESWFFEVDTDIGWKLDDSCIWQNDMMGKLE